MNIYLKDLSKGRFFTQDKLVPWFGGMTLHVFLSRSYTRREIGLHKILYKLITKDELSGIITLRWAAYERMKVVKDNILTKLKSFESVSCKN